MSTGPRFAVKFRRRREGNTNYKRRLGLLKSGKTRLVVRRTNRYITCQLVNYTPKGDVVLASETSQSLKKGGWKHGFNNLPAAYLTGYAIGLASKKAKVKEAILDYGLYDKVNGSRVYAVLKGAVDAGLNVPHDEKVFPKEDRLAGKHIDDKVEKDFAKLKSAMK